MARFLDIYTGNYAAAVNFAGKDIIVIGQTTETGAEMFSLGEHVDMQMLECETEFLELFTNNYHFLQGIGVACAMSRIDCDFMTMYRFSKDGTKTQLNFLPNGQIAE